MHALCVFSGSSVANMTGHDLPDMTGHDLPDMSTFLQGKQAPDEILSRTADLSDAAPRPGTPSHHGNIAGQHAQEFVDKMHSKFPNLELNDLLVDSADLTQNNAMLRRLLEQFLVQRECVIEDLFAEPNDIDTNHPHGASPKERAAKKRPSAAKQPKSDE